MNTHSLTHESNPSRKVGAWSITAFGLQSSVEVKFPCLEQGLGNVDAETYASIEAIIDQKIHQFQGYAPLEFASSTG